MPTDLPSHFTTLDVIGVTKGSPRWTVYFSNGSRFTQMYRTPDNLGYHAPEPHFFFGNVDEGPIVAKQDELGTRFPDGGPAMYAAYSAFLCSYAADNIRNNRQVKPTRPTRGESADGKRLLEVKGTAANPIGHNSRAALEAVTIDEAAKLLAEIRGRTSEVTFEDGLYCFADH